VSSRRIGRAASGPRNMSDEIIDERSYDILRYALARSIQTQPTRDSLTINEA
jgi:hypothetical protein